MTGYDKKRITLANHGEIETTITVELDAAGDGRFAAYQSFKLTPGQRRPSSSPIGLMPIGFGRFRRPRLTPPRS
jgi:hypothetical protein